jgi:hypothetical protein
LTTTEEYTVLKLKLGKLVISYGDPCERQECSYFSHYLREGPPDLPHTSYHAAEEACILWQTRAEKLMETGRDLSTEVKRMVEKYERMVRA